MFDTILVANRGEIALRVVRCCREMGIRSVVVHSTEDADSAAVAAADHAVCIGPAAARLSYLNMPAIIEAAQQTRAQAVHPGYGFLSENADFAEACVDHGLAFIGSPPSVISLLGDKARARESMLAAGIPMLPGSTAPVEGADIAAKYADDIGYPVIVKAVAGGGGRGMQVVDDPESLVHAYRATRGKAKALFGDDRVYLEKYLPAARHVEIQVLCDESGNGIGLGARDCSVQRRHQKIVEETPAPGISAGMLAEMQHSALHSVLSVGFVGAGTVEFLVSGDDFYFMEVNTRIQVEHPVTEMVTGIDLVREQIRIAAGERLDVRQQDVVGRGWSLECRVTAEDPDRGFLPTAGQLDLIDLPAGPFVRVDTDLRPGARVSAAYDPLLAKVVVWAPDREQALRRMSRALSEVRIAGPGIRTSVGFLQRVLAHPGFRTGAYDTTIVGDLIAGPEGRSPA